MLTRIPNIALPKGHEIEIRTIAALIHIGTHKNVRVQQAMLMLDEECFTDKDHRILFKLIRELFTAGNAFDFVEFITLVADEQFHIVNIAIKDEYLGSNSLEHDVQRLIDYKNQRRMIKTLVDTVNCSLEEPLPSGAIASINQGLKELSSIQHATGESIVRTYEQEIDCFLNTDDDDVFFPVNIPNLPPVPNRALITVAGRSGHGKTFFSMYLMNEIITAKPGKQTLYFNLEMHPHVMLERHATIMGYRAESRKELISKAAPDLLARNMSLISVPMITIEQIESESRLASLRQPIACIVVDYLGLVSSKQKYESKTIQQNDIAKRLAALSLELDCVVICLIQVNRDFKIRPVGDRCPVVSDSSEAMGSVNSATWWLGIDQPQNDDDSGEYKDLFMVACRKNRGKGGLFDFNLCFKNGMFSKYLKPFCAKQSSREGF